MQIPNKVHHQQEERNQTDLKCGRKKSECDFLWSFWKHLCKIFRRHLFHRLVNKIMFIFLPNAQQDILEMCQFFKVQNSTDNFQQSKKKKFARNKQQTKLSNRFSYWYLQILFFSLGDYVKFATTNQKNFQDTKLITRIGCIQRLELKQFGFFLLTALERHLQFIESRLSSATRNRFLIG